MRPGSFMAGAAIAVVIAIFFCFVWTSNYEQRRMLERLESTAARVDIFITAIGALEGAMAADRKEYAARIAALERGLAEVSSAPAALAGRHVVERIELGNIRISK